MKSSAQIKSFRSAVAKSVRETAEDIKRMERIQSDATWLNARDSNSSDAWPLTNSISALIDRALRFHRSELKSLQRIAKKGRP
jgi:hypothetical protein